MNIRAKISGRANAAAIGLSISLAAFASSCGGGGGGSYGTEPGGQTNPGNGNPSGGGTASNTVTLAQSSFTPETVNIPPGTTVTWKWSPCSGDGYSACPAHNIAFDDGS